MKYLIELTEADSGLPTYEWSKDADTEVFVGGTTKRPAKLRFDSDGEWALFDLTAFHPDGRQEQITFDEYQVRLGEGSRKHKQLYDRVDAMIESYLQAVVESYHD